MPVNFTQFKQDIKNYLENENIQKTSLTTAETIVKSYVDNVISIGGDTISQNSLQIINPKKIALEQGFKNMFEISLNSNIPLNLNLVIPSLLSFWTGGTLTLTGLVPGTIQTTSAIVTIPGVATPIPFPSANNSANQFLTTLETFFKTHLLTINFLIIGLVPAPPAPPIPTPFPSIGYI